MVLNGQSFYFNKLRSTTAELINLVIACKPLQLTAKVKTIVKIYRLGLEIPLLITFDGFEVYPLCMEPAQIKYEA